MSVKKPAESELPILYWFFEVEGVTPLAAGATPKFSASASRLLIDPRLKLCAAKWAGDHLLLLEGPAGSQSGARSVHPIQPASLCI